MVENKGFNSGESMGFGWDDEVVEQTFELMPPGDYHFTVVGMERGWYEPKRPGKISACNQADIEMQFSWVNASGLRRNNKLTYSLKLTQSLAFLIFQFFASIGLHHEGDGMTRFPWDQIIGKTGIAKVGQREGTTGRIFNTVDSVYPPEKAPTVCADDPKGADKGSNEADIPF